MLIRKQILRKIQDSSPLKAKIADAVHKHYVTVDRWAEQNHPALTQASALKVIREELKLTDDQILEDVKNTAA